MHLVSTRLRRCPQKEAVMDESATLAGSSADPFSDLSVESPADGRSRSRASSSHGSSVRERLKNSHAAVTGKLREKLDSLEQAKSRESPDTPRTSSVGTGMQDRLMNMCVLLRNSSHCLAMAILHHHLHVCMNVLPAVLYDSLHASSGKRCCSIGTWNTYLCVSGSCSRSSRPRRMTPGTQTGHPLARQIDQASAYPLCLTTFAASMPGMFKTRAFIKHPSYLH